MGQRAILDKVMAKLENGISTHNEANARLIAAAPELLEALKAVEVAVTMGFPSAEILQDDSAIRKGIRAAIAKAEGREP